ncbi:MAG: P-II family nitrogen regulator [Lachnospiraceae bacterium]|nr:P-II family nitrogen regulator [Lachnospiraceae bacterium]
MSKLYLMTTIIDRNLTRKFLKLYDEEGLQVMLITLGAGTASGAVLDYLGLEAAEKAVIFTVLEENRWVETKTDLQRKFQIDVPGGGIAFIVPLSSIGGKKALEFLTANQEYQKEEESVLKDTVHELIVVIANQGNIEVVMDAARGAGAYGGTVIHAKGTGMEQAEKFMGVSIAAEKEMIFIVAKKEQKNDIMKAIMEQAGIETEAKAIVFSLPVTDTAGLRLLEE